MVPVRVMVVHVIQEVTRYVATMTAQKRSCRGESYGGGLCHRARTMSGRYRKSGRKSPQVFAKVWQARHNLPRCPRCPPYFFSRWRYGRSIILRFYLKLRSISAMTSTIYLHLDFAFASVHRTFDTISSLTPLFYHRSISIERACF